MASLARLGAGGISGGLGGALKGTIFGGNAILVLR